MNIVEEEGGRKEEEKQRRKKEEEEGESGWWYEITYCIGARWIKWKLASAVLRDKNISLRLKDKFYKVVIKPTTILYEAKVKEKSGYTSRVKVRNDDICDNEMWPSWWIKKGKRD